MEQETIVLLENRNSVLPLSKDIGSIALIGPQVDRVSVRDHTCSAQGCSLIIKEVRRLRFLQREPERYQPVGRLYPTFGEHFHQDQLRRRL